VTAEGVVTAVEIVVVDRTAEVTAEGVVTAVEIMVVVLLAPEGATRAETVVKIFPHSPLLLQLVVFLQVHRQSPQVVRRSFRGQVRTLSGWPSRALVRYS
jgi:hypothetical protein